jgi:Spy/CpxP family protein refolding chaperone
MSRKLLWSLGLSLLAVSLVASPVLGQQGRGRGLFGRQSVVSLAGNEAVQKDLGVTDASKLNAVAEEYRNAVREAMSGLGIDFGALRDLPEAERAAKMREVNEKTEAAQAKVTETLLPKLKEALSADQIKRLGEIRIQADGIASLSDAAVVKELGLSEEQQKKIADIRTEGERARRELFGSGNNQEAVAKMREITAQTLTKATDVLDAGQKEKFTALKGKPFDVSQLGFGGRGRRGNNN